MNLISLRKFPYRYRAALTIANDLDNLRIDDFLAIRQYLNSTQSTPMGEGLGLEIGETFWCYSLLPYEVTYFNGLSAGKSPHAPILKELIEAGYIDCFHSYGNFSRWENPPDPAYFERKLAETALDRLAKDGIKFDTYINHGDNYNRQNLLCQLIEAYGDDPESEAYHSDLTIENLGIYFYWGCDLTAVVGQDRSLNLGDMDYFKFKTEHLVKSLIKYLIGRKHKIRKVFGNELMRPRRLRDRQLLMEFTRYCYSYGNINFPPNRDILKKQLSTEVLDKLERNRGTMIIYTHFGQPLEREDGQIFDTELCKRFRELKSRQESERIWITTTSRMLNYHYTNKYLVWDSEKVSEGAYRINIKGTNGPVDVPPNYEGITFYAGEPEKIEIYIMGESAGKLTINPPDDTGKRSVTIPVKPLEFPHGLT
ncbi:MAG: hypothetical protein GF307_07910 [candidate division Zixibacteria bacterium]|nr:hypothetical protein [candidate division Zixibacteria bacterium]